MWLEFKPVQRFRFAFEMINRTKLGPREPGHAVAWGKGALTDDDGLIKWSLQVDRVNADTVGPFSQAKFATLSLLVDHRDHRVEVPADRLQPVERAALVLGLHDRGG